MGYPMAGHLKAAGHQVTVYNRTAEKADKWVTEHGGDKAGTPDEAAKGCEFVFACVGDDADIGQSRRARMARSGQWPQMLFLLTTPPLLLMWHVNYMLRLLRRSAFH